MHPVKFGQIGARDMYSGAIIDAGTRRFGGGVTPVSLIVLGWFNAGFCERVRVCPTNATAQIMSVCPVPDRQCFTVGAMGLWVACPVFVLSFIHSFDCSARISSRLRTVQPNLVNGAMVPTRVLEF